MQNMIIDKGSNKSWLKKNQIASKVSKKIGIEQQEISIKKNYSFLIYNMVHLRKRKI